MILRDEGSLFSFPLGFVWEFLNYPEEHTRAHLHSAVRRERTGEYSGRYSWEQSFGRGRSRFTMEWTSFPPLGIAYDVVEGPFAGSTFFLYYLPRGRRTEVGILGDFRSPTLAGSRLRHAVNSFFQKEFEQDHRAMRELYARLPAARRKVDPPRSRAERPMAARGRSKGRA